TWHTAPRSLEKRPATVMERPLVPEDGQYESVDHVSNGRVLHPRRTQLVIETHSVREAVSHSGKCGNVGLLQTDFERVVYELQLVGQRRLKNPVYFVLRILNGRRQTVSESRIARLRHAPENSRRESAQHTPAVPADGLVYQRVRYVHFR